LMRSASSVFNVNLRLRPCISLFLNLISSG
jgi:hypothetical protein